MAGKFEITKAGDGTFSFEFLIDGTPVAQSPVFEKEDACRRGVKAVKKNSRMKVQNAFAGDEEKTNPKYLVEPAENGARFTLFLQTGEPCLTGTAADEAAALAVIEQIGNNANAAQMAMAEVVLSENELRQIRLNKLQALQEAGQDPFQITKAEQTHHTADVRADFDALENTDVTLCGRMMSRRDMGKANFVDLSDRTGRMQIYVRMNDVGEDVFRAFKKWDIGDLFQVSLFELVELFGAHVEDLQHVVVGKLGLALESIVEALDDRSHVDFGAQFGLAIDLPGNDVAERSTHTVRLLLDLRLRSLCKCHGAHGQRKRGRENDFFQGKHNFLN